MSDTSLDEAKAQEKKGLVEKIGAALPIGLTALATVFAGMSTSALQQAMFWRSAAAQDQSKATNQWTLAGFKRDRSLIVQTTAAQLRATAGYETPAFPVSVNSAPEMQQALAWLDGKGPPKVELPKVEDHSLLDLMEAIRKREPEAELLKKAAKVPATAINDALDKAEKAAEEIDAAWEGTIKAAAKLVADEAKVKPDLAAAERAKKLAQATAAQATGFELEQRRYRAESTLNQGIGFLYEARVKVSTAESDRHREKSKLFFYAMLAAQIGAVVSSIAMARKTRSALWVFASVIGLVSLGFGAYVFLEP